MGPPGSGKGTVAEDMRKAMSLHHASTGDMLRQAIAEGHSFSNEVRVYMERGELVPDRLILKLIQDMVDNAAEGSRYLFDGFPRTMVQATAFDQLLAARGSKVDKVFLLDLDRAVLSRRICGRRICRSCGAVYNIHSKKPKTDGVCDVCGGRDLYQRVDDNEDTLNNRLDVYEKQTAELIDFYEKKGVLVRVDAEDRQATREAILKHFQS